MNIRLTENMGYSATKVYEDKNVRVAMGRHNKYGHTNKKMICVRLKKFDFYVVAGEDVREQVEKKMKLKRPGKAIEKYILSEILKYLSKKPSEFIIFLNNFRESIYREGRESKRDEVKEIFRSICKRNPKCLALGVCQ